jgi:hypothetical protein
MLSALFTGTLAVVMTMRAIATANQHQRVWAIDIIFFIKN